MMDHQHQALPQPVTGNLILKVVADMGFPWCHHGLAIAKVNTGNI